MNEINVVESDRVAGPVMVKVTAIFAGEPKVPVAVAVTVTLPVYVPAVSVPTFAETVKVAEVVPLVGLTVSQDESLAAVKPRDPPPPAFVTDSEEDAGFDPP